MAGDAFFNRIDLSAHGFYAVDGARCGYDWDRPNGDRGMPFNYWTQGAAVAEVELDCLTGDFEVRRADVLVDLGCSINPALDVGQIEGAFVQGAGWLTTEELIVSEAGHGEGANHAWFGAPPGTLQRYRIMEWMSFIASDLHKGGFMPLFKKTTPDDYRPLARQLVVSRMKLLDEHLADRDYLTGSVFTIADAHCYAIAMWTHYHDIDLAPWPNLSAYLERISQRPSAQAAKAAERAEAKRQGYEGKV